MEGVEGMEGVECRKLGIKILKPKKKSGLHTHHSPL
jgi:ribosomal protein L40E